MKTFYPQKNIPYYLITLASLSAFILKGDEAVIQDVDVSDVITNNIYHSDLDDEWVGFYPRLGLDEH